MSRDNPRTSSLLLGAVVVAAVLARLAAMAAGGFRFEDPDNYLPLARSLASGEGLELRGRLTAYRPPLYPLLLAPLVAASGDRPAAGLAAFHLLLGAGTAALAWLAARRLGASPLRATAAGLIAALDPVLAWQARSVMTETLAAFLLASALAVAAGSRASAVGSGLLLGLASLCRPSLLPGAGLAALAALMASPGVRRVRAQRAAALAAAVLLVMLPWAVRNRVVLGEFVWTTTHGGYTLALANNPVYYREVLDGPPGVVWHGPDQQAWWEDVNRRTAGMPEPVADRVLRDEALDLARRRPGTFARACLARLATFWSPMPAAGVYGPRARWLTFAWTAPLWIAFGLGLTSKVFRRWPGVLAVCFILGLTAVHAFYWTDLRMRSPIVPAIAVVAAFATLRRPRTEG